MKILGFLFAYNFKFSYLCNKLNYMMGTHSLKELLNNGGKLKANGNVITKYGNKGVSYWSKEDNGLYHNFNNVTIY